MPCFARWYAMLVPTHPPPIMTVSASSFSFLFNRRPSLQHFLYPLNKQLQLLVITTFYNASHAAQPIMNFVDSTIYVNEDISLENLKKTTTYFICIIYSGKRHSVIWSQLHMVLTIQHRYNMISIVHFTLDVMLFMYMGRHWDFSLLGNMRGLKTPLSL